MSSNYIVIEEGRLALYRRPSSPFFYYDLRIGDERDQRSTGNGEAEAAERIAREQLSRAEARAKRGAIHQNSDRPKGLGRVCCSTPLSVTKDSLV